MRRSHAPTLALLLWSLVLLAPALPATGSGYDARHLIETLYTAGGQLPIRDMIVELEGSDATGESGSLAPSGTDKIMFKHPNKIRVDSIIKDPGGPLDGRQIIIIRDGTNRWQFVSTGQYPVKKGPDDPVATLNLPFYVQRYPQDSGLNYELLGDQPMDGVNAQVVRISNPQTPQDVRTVWVDPARLVPLRVELQQPAEGGTRRVRVDYKDVRALEDGRYLPFRIEVYEGTSLIRVRIYKGVKVNVGLADSLFEPMSRFIR